MTSPPSAALNRAIGDVRLVGGLFVCLGFLPLVMSLNWGHDTLAARLLAIVDTLVLVGPGVWYLVAGVIMRRTNRQAVTTSMRVAVAQLVLVAAMIPLGIFAGAMGLWAEIFLVPAALALFFVPALIALLFVLRRIRWLMNQVAPEAHGFELTALPVMPLDAPDDVTETPGREDSR